MGVHSRKSALFEAIAVMGKAFASPRRLELLAQAPRPVDELARASGQSNANASQHLQALHAAGLVTRAREGMSVRYALAGPEVLALWLALRDTSAARLAEVQRAADDYLGEDVETIGRQELPADREIVAYCRGPFCAYAHEAVRRLRAAGHTARRLEDGWPEWRLATQMRQAASR